MKTKLPISLYIVNVLSILFFLFFIPSFSEAIVYTSTLYIILYLMFTRHSCRILVEDNFIKIKYFYIWEKNINFQIKGKCEIDYKKGFYDFFSDKSFQNLFNFPIYNFDRILIAFKQPNIDTIYLDVNTRMFQFEKVIKFLSRNVLPE